MATKKRVAKSTAKSTIKPVTLDDIFGKKPRFRGGAVEMMIPLAKPEIYATNEDGLRIVTKRYDTGDKAGVLFDLADIKKAPFEKLPGYKISSDLKSILFEVGRKKVAPHIIAAEYYIHTVGTKVIKKLTRRPEVRMAQYSPTGDKVGFVSRNNLYYVDVKNLRETAVTKDGKKNRIIYGAPDWVHNEEAGLGTGFFWSPNSRQLLYYRFDETKVPLITMTFHEMGYPKETSYKYPRAGEPNAEVELYAYNLETKKHTRLKVESKCKKGEPKVDEYFLTPLWVDNSRAIVSRVNRHQNKFEYMLINTKTGAAKVILTLTSDTYVETHRPIMLPDKKHFILLAELDGYRHIHLYDLKGTHVRALTKGRFDVMGIIGIQKKTNRVLYTAARPKPINLTCYSVKLDGTGTTKLSKKTGVNNLRMTKDGAYLINSWSNYKTPPVTTLQEGTGKLIRTLQNNSKLKKVIAEQQVPCFQPIDLRGADGQRLDAAILKPANFSSKKQYPVMFNVYGGPDSKGVRDSWSFGWEQALSAAGIIVVRVDNRGTGARGTKFRKCTYLQLGKLEIEDQIAAAKELGELPYINAKRIGFFGWSYGGFMALGAILRGCDAFSLSIAVASVTSFRFYDSIYTERYMRTPQENIAGYDDYAPLSHADKLKGKLLLVHGLTDDNVHAQNSFEMAEKLVEADKPFDMHYAMNKDHGIGGGNTSRHLFTKFFNFACEGLLGKKKRSS